MAENVTEDFWLIIVTDGNGDEAEIHGAEIGCQAARPGYPAADAQTHSAEDHIRIVLSGLRSADSIAELCRREGTAESLNYSWSTELLEAARKRLSGDKARQTCTGEIKDLRREIAI